MPNPRLAERYAKGLLGLAIEKNQLEEVYNNILFLQSLCKSSREFVNLLRSPIVKPDKKDIIIKKIVGGKINEMTLGFIHLLVKKGREENLPEMITAFIGQYKVYKNIYIIKLITAVPVSDELKQSIVSKVQSQTAMKNVELETEVDDNLIGGFRLEMGDMLVDASILYDLNKIKSQFMNNDFIYKIR